MFVVSLYFVFCIILYCIVFLFYIVLFVLYCLFYCFKLYCGGVFCIGLCFLSVGLCFLYLFHHTVVSTSYCFIFCCVAFVCI